MSERKFCTICKTYAHILLVKFPADVELRKIWVDRTGITPKNNLDTSTRICHIHFADDDWTYRLNNADQVVRTLKPTAIPSLYVGDQAPVPDPSNYVPKQTSNKNVRCAMCNTRCFATDCVSIFDSDDLYTDFGVMFTTVLQMSCRILMSRFVCLVCSNNIAKCFEAMVDINVSTLITTRLLQMKADVNAKPGQNLFLNEEYEEEQLPQIRASVGCKIDDLDELGLSGRCRKCNTLFSSLDKYTDHFLMHIFLENRKVYRKTVAMTQTNELEMEIGMCDIFEDIEEVEEVEAPQRKGKRRLQPSLKDAAESTEDEGFAGSNDEYKVEFLDDEFFENVVMIQDSIRNIPECTVALSDQALGAEDPSSYDMESVIRQEMTGKYDDSLADVTVEVLEDEMDLDKFQTETADVIGGSILDANEIDPLGPESLAEFSATDQSTKKVKKKKKKKMQSGTNTGQRVCHVCGAVLKHLKSYMAHLLLHDNPKKNFKTCPNCGKLCGNLSQHRKTCAKQMAREHTVKERKTPTVNCGICGKIVCEKYLAKHLHNHDIEDDVAREGPAALDKYLQSCNLCGKRVKHLYWHMIKSHKIKMGKEMGLLTEPPSTYECEHCGSQFLQRPLFVIHLVLKHNLDPRLLNSRSNSWGCKAQWPCSVCGAIFLTYNSIRKHTLDEHNGIGLDLSCELCTKRYNCLRSLRSHINIKHIDYYKFHCNPCDMYFVKEESFREHQAFRCRANLRKRGRKDGSSAKRIKPEKFYMPFHETVIADEEVFYITE